MRCILWGLVTCLLASVDLHCKTYMENNYDKLKRKEICDGRIELRKVHNKGMAMGAGENYPETTRLASGLVCLTTCLRAIPVWSRNRGFWKKLAVARLNTFPSVQNATRISKCIDKILANLYSIFEFLECFSLIIVIRESRKVICL